MILKTIFRNDLNIISHHSLLTTYCSPGGKRGSSPGFPVLFLHGLGENHLTWEKILDRLDLRHYRTIVVDLPGHGPSTTIRMQNCSHCHLSSLLVDLFQKMGIKKVIIVGHSLGANLALRMASQNPEMVQSLFLLSPAIFSVRGLPLSRFVFANPLLHPFIIRVANKTLRSPEKLKTTLQEAVFNSDIVDDDFFQRIAQPVLDNPRSALALSCYLRDSSQNHVLPKLAAINQPTVILHGLQDPWVPIAESFRLTKILSSATLIQIPDCGHMPQEEKPDLVTQQLTSFLSFKYQ